MFQIAGGNEERGHLGLTQHEGQFLLAAWIRDMLHHPGLAEGFLIEEPQGTNGLHEGVPGDLLLDEQELIGADIFGA